MRISMKVAHIWNRTWVKIGIGVGVGIGGYI